jgi:SAM-dependent methyltransferase
MDSGTDRGLAPWDGADYAANTAHHRRYDAWFLAGTPLAAGQRVLDLGCGSGDFTATVADLVGPGGHVVGLDAQPSMLDQARAVARPNQSFVEGPAQHLSDLLAGEAPFDVVLSRSVLHWVPAGELPGIWRAAAAALRPGGWLRVECGGAGNIPRVLPVLDEESARAGGPVSPWTFLDAAEALDLAEGAGLDAGHDAGGFARTTAQRRSFDEATLVGWLRSQCYQAYEVAMPADRTAGFRAAVEARLDDLRRPDGTLDQTFVRLDVLARRPPAGGRPGG